MTTHDHDFDEAADVVDPLGGPADIAVLRRFIGAGIDGCSSCQENELQVIASDAATCARLVHMACGAVDDALGGLPKSMIDPDAPGTSSPEFRALARAGLDGKVDEMVKACEAMSPDERRKAADTAADTFVGMLGMP